MVKVVIVGGGFAGVGAATSLISAFKTHPEQIDITLIEKRHGFVTHNYASLRGMVDEKWGEAIYVNNSALFSKSSSSGRVITGTAAKIESNKVILQDGSTVPFDYAVLAMGSQNQSKTKHLEKSDAVKEFHEIADGIRKAKTILIVGAGAVGVELAGEIASAYTDKKVTLISSNSFLIGSQYKPSLTTKLTDQLHKFHVNVVLNERVVIPEGQDTILPNGLQFTSTHTAVKTASGKSYEADFVFLATGNSKLNTEAVEVGLGGAALNDKKEVKVKESLQLVEHDNIFALGDIAAVKGHKVGWVTAMQAPVVAKNIFALVNHKKLSATYKGQPMDMIAVALGPNDGAVQTPLGVFGSWATKGMKSKQLFLPLTYQNLNVKAPEGLW